MSNGTRLRLAGSDTMGLSGETESGSAGTQPDKGYPGSGAPMARQAPDSKRRPGPLSYLPIGHRTYALKILRRSRLWRNGLHLRALQSDEPQMWRLRWHVAAERGDFAAAFPLGLWSGS